MNKFAFICYSLVILTGFLVAVFAQDLSPQEILEHMESVLYPDNFHMLTELKTVKPGKADSITEMEVYYKKGIGTLIEILAPSRSKGIRYLQKGESIWIFNPKTNSRKAIRLSLKDSFQGSVFSNNDIGDPQYSDDYYVAIREGTESITHPQLGEQKCQILILTAKSESSAYGKIVAWCTVKDHLPLKMEYYVQSGLLFRKITFSDFKTTAGVLRPTLFHMESLDMEGTYSEFYIKSMEDKQDIPDIMFTETFLTM